MITPKYLYRRLKRWLRWKRGIRVDWEPGGGGTNKDILKAGELTGIFKQTCYPPDYSIKDN